jgi:hypothetical protein
MNYGTSIWRDTLIFIADIKYTGKYLSSRTVKKEHRFKSFYETVKVPLQYNHWCEVKDYKKRGAIIRFFTP